MFFDTALSFPVQWPLVKGLGFPASRLVPATDFPYTAVGDNGVAALEAMSTKTSGQVTEKEVEDDIVYRNALTNLFPRLKQEWHEAFGEMACCSGVFSVLAAALTRWIFEWRLKLANSILSRSKCLSVIHRFAASILQRPISFRPGVFRSKVDPSLVFPKLHTLDAKIALH